MTDTKLIFPKKLMACWHPVGYSYEIKKDTQDTVDHRGLLEDVLNYSNLKMLLSRKLNRVL